MRVNAIQGRALALLNNPTSAKTVKNGLLLIGAAALVTSAAVAGTDTTFDSTVSQLTDWTEGSATGPGIVGALASAIF